MGTECIGAQLNNDPDGIPSVPPGFASLASFTLQRVQDNALGTACTPSPLQTKVELGVSTIGDGKFKKTLRHRPWVNYSQFDNSSDEEESDSEPIKQVPPAVRFLPKGVIRGCADGVNCQKVTAKWHPEDACRPVLDEAPVFYPNEEEFQDTLKYIASIRPVAEPYGICRIVPPPSWTPPCQLKEKNVWENSQFTTRIQKVHKLQNRESVKKILGNHNLMRSKRRKLLKFGAESRESNENVAETTALGCYNNAERFGFEPGPNFTLESFQKYADDFMDQYFRTRDMDADLTSMKWEPSPESIEGEYWRIVEKPTEEIEVLYGADLETGDFGSGFPKAGLGEPHSDIDDLYVKSGWNLNNFPRLPGSVLAFESGDISGVLVPWLYIGMCFSSFCWHVEDHHLYSLNYLHWGAPKMWYGVPGRDALKLEDAMKKHLADLFEEQPDLLHNLVTQFSPAKLKLEGVPVYRCLQHSGEFVLTFPRAYHSGFNCGFNCAEAVNVAPVDWLPHGLNAIELYREQVRKISISHDKLLLGAAREAVRAQWNISFLKNKTLDNLRWKDACGFDGILVKSLKARVELERVRREFLCSPQSRKMDAGFDVNTERECAICHYDLHLSAAGCPCSPDRFACLTHAKQLCSCDWSMRCFLFRYEITELNTLIEAVGGKLSAVHRWGLTDLGLSLSSFVTKEKTPESKPPQNKAISTESTKLKDKGPTCQGILSGGAKTSSSEMKTSILQPTSVEVPKGRENMSAMVGQAHIMTDISSLRQQNKPTSMTTSNRIISPEATIDKRPLCQGSLNGGAKTSSQEMKASILQPSSLEVSKERVNMSPMVGSACIMPETSSVRQQNMSTSMLTSKTSCQGVASCKIEDDQKLHPREGGSSSHQNEMATAYLVPGRSNTDDAVSETVKSMPATDRAVDALKGPQVLPSDQVKQEPFVENSKALARLNHDDNVTICNSQKDRVLVTPETNASFICEKDNSSQYVVQKLSSLSNPTSVQAIDQGGCPSNLPNHCLVNSVPRKPSHCENPLSRSISKNLSDKKDSDCSITSSGSPLQHLDLLVSVNTNDERNGGKTESDSGNKVTDREPVTAGPSSLPNGLDRPNRMQKGPRMAKVVRRINCNVETLEYGIVLSGKLWSTSQAIFPKGYRSRVKYFSVLDPTQMCYYVSEILDAELLGPLFMVKVEHCPSEVFINVSATKCWDMVRDRVNNEIRKQHHLGRPNLPSLQPPGSLDGLEMFGLTSPTVIQAVEAIDKNRWCSEYWRSRPRPPPTALAGDNLSGPEEERGRQHLLTGANIALAGLLKKANHEELHALHNVLNSDEASSKRELNELLDEEMKKRLI